MNKSNRAIERHLGSDEVAYIKVPRMTYEFPPDFPELARRKIAAGRLRAERALEEKRHSIRDFTNAETLLLQFILQIFIAFVKEGHKLGMQGQLTAANFESESMKFLRCYALQAGLMDGYLGRAIDGHTPIPEDVLNKIECSDQWEMYRQLLQEVADTQADDELPVDQGRGETAGESVRGIQICGPSDVELLFRRY
jgi:hypothetical protein